MIEVGSGFVNPSFRSEDLTLHSHRVHGTVAMYLVSNPGAVPSGQSQCSSIYGDPEHKGLGACSIVKATMTIDVQA